MKEIKVVINEFGPLKNVELEFAPFMIFTGESSIGKSYVNYLMYYLTSAFTTERLMELIDKKVEEDKRSQSFTITEDEIRRWLNDGAEPFMRSFVGDESLICNVNFIFSLGREDNALNISYTHRTSKKTSVDKVLMGWDVLELCINNQKSSATLLLDKVFTLSNAIERIIKITLFEKNFERPVILPPARGALVNANYSLKQSIGKAAGMYDYFLRDYDFGKKRVILDKNDEQFYLSRIKELIGGDLVSDKDAEYLVLSNGQRINLNAAASSIKEISPLLFYIKNWSGVNLSIFFEEPEAHLHPDMQIKLADLIAACFNKNMCFSITTHSDYFIQRINQLIKLGEIRKRDEETFASICKERELNRRFYLEKENIKAYYFYREDKKVVIKDLPIGEQGIPFATFFDTIKNLSERDNYINEKWEELNTASL